jgi:prephenate dehydratase
MRAGYFGPEGTYTHEALLASLHVAAGETGEVTEVALPTIHDVVMAVQDQLVDRAIVPIENSVEGSVDATLDALAFETTDVVIAAETVLPIHHCLIARHPLALEDIEVVISHPQANAQCARFVRERLRRAQVMTGASTAEAVRTVVGHDGAWAALGPRTAAERYGGVVLAADVVDVEGNETRFAWLARRERAGEVAPASSNAGGAKTAIVFWPPTSDAPGWLMSCLGEFSGRGVNMTRIESRPRKVGLGEYVFFVDLTGAADDPAIVEALQGLRGHVETLRVLGSFGAV